MITILLFCVFGVGPRSEGQMKTVPVAVAPRDYDELAHEKGHTAKIRLCREYFDAIPDLAWIEIYSNREM